MVRVNDSNRDNEATMPEEQWVMDGCYVNGANYWTRIAEKQMAWKRQICDRSIYLECENVGGGVGDGKLDQWRRMTRAWREIFPIPFSRFLEKIKKQFYINLSSNFLLRRFLRPFLFPFIETCYRRWNFHQFLIL